MWVNRPYKYEDSAFSLNPHSPGDTLMCSPFQKIHSSFRKSLPEQSRKTLDIHTAWAPNFGSLLEGKSPAIFEGTPGEGEIFFHLARNTRFGFFTLQKITHQTSPNTGMTGKSGVLGTFKETILHIKKSPQQKRRNDQKKSPVAFMFFAYLPTP